MTRLVGSDGSPLSSDSSAHAEIMRLLALVAVVRHDLGVTARALSASHAALATVADGLCGVAALHGVKPTREEVLDVIKTLQGHASKNGSAAASHAAPEPASTPIQAGPEEGSAPSGPAASEPASDA